eukprot:TRINITY_DN12008_c0_g2_i1.p1 TRINITY_DN12008_c0_g2~~TRINITY_DN12008_c0_g2_i1.p1  ORF type:complete len:408 (-),score=149.82 TRINITY_DN12008_c0_g2_i1:143-1366(-)
MVLLRTSLAGMHVEVLLLLAAAPRALCLGGKLEVLSGGGIEAAAGVGDLSHQQRLLMRRAAVTGEQLSSTAQLEGNSTSQPEANASAPLNSSVQLDGNSTNSTAQSEASSTAPPLNSSAQLERKAASEHAVEQALQAKVDQALRKNASFEASDEMLKHLAGLLEELQMHRKKGGSKISLAGSQDPAATTAAPAAEAATAAATTAAPATAAAAATTAAPAAPAAAPAAAATTAAPAAPAAAAPATTAAAAAAAPAATTAAPAAAGATTAAAAAPAGGGNATGGADKGRIIDEAVGAAMKAAEETGSKGLKELGPLVYEATSQAYDAALAQNQKDKLPYLANLAATEAATVGQTCVLLTAQAAVGVVNGTEVDVAAILGGKSGASSLGAGVAYAVSAAAAWLAILTAAA